MDHPSLYDDDIVAWSEEQAAALRALAARPELSNALDWEMIAEEIEGAGRSEVGGVESAILLTLVHVLKYASAPRAQSVSSWRTEVITFQASARRSYRPSMRRRIDWDDLWVTAKRRAEGELAIFGDRLLAGLPDAMPFTPDDIVARDFDMDAALARIATSLARTDDRH
jgi:hypothetical protein